MSKRTYKDIPRPHEISEEQWETLNISLSNRMLITMGYTSLVVPFKQGLKISKALEKAELYEKKYQKLEKVRDITENDIKVSPISSTKYFRAKMNALLVDDTAED